MKHYTSIYEIPFENYYRVINTGNPVYLYVFKQNNRESELDIENPPVEFPKEFYTIWDNMLYQFETVKYTELFTASIQLTLNLIKLATLDTPNSHLKVETSRLIERLYGSDKEDKQKINIGKAATDIDMIFDFKKNIFSQRFTMSIAEFKALQDSAMEILEARKQAKSNQL